MESTFKEAFENNEKIKIGDNWYKLIAIETHEDYKFSEFLIVEKEDPPEAPVLIKSKEVLTCPKCYKKFIYSDKLEKDSDGNISCDHCGYFFPRNKSEVVG